jgi:hypothetical protein
VPADRELLAESFSADGGKTWELDLVVNETLTRD